MRFPVLPSQCYSTSPDDGVEGRHGTSASRQPLRESTGNAQYSHIAWYSEQIRQLGAASGLASMSPSIPTPPIVPTQSFGPDYGSSTPSVYGRQQQRHHYQGHRVTNFRRRQFEENPLIPLLPAAFQNYRKKQADKTDQKWTDVLEWGFIDGKSYLQHEQCLVLFAKRLSSALLLIPQMKRRKYTMKQTQFGRNMLIGEYLWIYYLQTLPPGTEAECNLVRHRKQVSSHIQVLKQFFANHRCCKLHVPILPRGGSLCSVRKCLHNRQKKQAADNGGSLGSSLQSTFSSTAATMKRTRTASRRFP